MKISRLEYLKLQKENTTLFSIPNLLPPKPSVMPSANFSSMWMYMKSMCAKHGQFTFKNPECPIIVQVYTLV